MQGSIVCREVLYAGKYCTQGSIVCREVLYAGKYCMQGSIVCREVLYAGKYCMQGKGYIHIYKDFIKTIGLIDLSKKAEFSKTLTGDP